MFFEFLILSGISFFFPFFFLSDTYIKSGISKSHKIEVENNGSHQVQNQILSYGTQLIKTNQTTSHYERLDLSSF